MYDNRKSSFLALYCSECAHHSGFVTDCATVDGKLFVSTANDAFVRIWDTTRPDVKRQTTKAFSSPPSKRARKKHKDGNDDFNFKTDVVNKEKLSKKEEILK